jgi:hypothetical protein
VNVFLKTIKKELKYKQLEIQTSFNRNIYILKFFGGEILKTEFTYFPFEQIRKPIFRKGVYIDTKLDIAVNKIFTIYQNPRTRDFVDVYYILKTKEFSLSKLVRYARIKFDTYIDPLQLGSQFMKCTKTSDYPTMIKSFEESKWQDFFIREAVRLKNKVVT